MAQIPGVISRDKGEAIDVLSLPFAFGCQKVRVTVRHAREMVIPSGGVDSRSTKLGMPQTNQNRTRSENQKVLYIDH